MTSDDALHTSKRIYFCPVNFPSSFQGFCLGRKPFFPVYLSFFGSFFLAGLDLASPIAQFLISKWGIWIVLVLGLELASFSTQIWQLCLTQGLLFGVGTSFNYVATLSATPQWLTKRRELAFGIISGGAGLGGLTIPFITNTIRSSLGHQWAFCILRFVCLGCNVMPCCFVKERTQTEKTTKWTQIIRFDSLKNVNYLLFSVGSGIGLFGYFIPYFILPSYAAYLGLCASQGKAIVAVTSATKIISVSSCLTIWMLDDSYGMLMTFAVVFGSTGGSYYSMISSIPASLVGMKKLPSALSILLVSNIFSEFNTNIASAIESNASTPPFLTNKLFTGITYLVGTLFLIVLRLRVHKKLFTKV
ncbi:MFS general substrate transporter [Backusella circina FSU 941]|nr:MFS general substrate transporter [Backusella circina FSU 941]